MFNEHVLDRMPSLGKPYSIENDVLPEMAMDEDLFMFKHNMFWKDIGTPREFLIGQARYIKR